MTQPTVFISYSRVDAAFCARLAGALEQCGFRSVYDRSQSPHDDPDLRLTGQDEWWKALCAMIAASDLMVFIVSPESAASPVCDDELAHARNLGKRIVSILRRQIDFNSAPERLRALNVGHNFFDDSTDAFTTSLEGLRRELETDIDWVRQGTRLMRLAQQWKASGSPDSQLLRLGAIAEADDWTAKRPHNAPPAGPDVLTYLAASRERERTDRRNLLRHIGIAYLRPAQDAVQSKRHDLALRLAGVGIIRSEDVTGSIVPERPQAIAAAALQNRLLSTLEGHTDSVNGARFSRDGSFIATVSSDLSTRVWDAQTFKERARLEHHQALLGRVNGVESVEMSPDGHLFATGGWDGSANIYNARTFEHLGELEGHGVDGGGPVSVRFSPDCKKMVTISGDDAFARLYSTGSFSQTTAQILQGAKSDLDIQAAAFSEDGQLFAFGGLRGIVTLWRIGGAASSVAELVCGAGIEALHFVERSHDLISICDDGSMQLWRKSAGTPDWTIQQVVRGPSKSEAASISTKGTMAAVAGADQVVRVWRPENSADLAELLHSDGDFTALAFSSDASMLACGAKTGHISVWRRCDHDWQEIDRLVGHSGWITSLDFDPTGKLLVSASSDNTAKVWDVRRGDPEPVSINGQNASLEDANAEHAILRVTHPPQVQLIRLSDTRPGPALERCDDKYEGVRFNGDGRYLTGFREKSEWVVWSVADGKIVARESVDDGRTGWRLQKGVRNATKDLHLGQYEGRWATTAGAKPDLCYQVRSLVTARLVFEFQDNERHCRECVFTPDDQFVLARFKDHLEIRAADDGRTVGKAHHEDMQGAVFDAAAQRLFTFSSREGRTIRVFDTAGNDITPHELRQFNIRYYVNAFAVAPRGNSIFVGSNSGEAWILSKTAEGTWETKALESASERTRNIYAGVWSDDGTRLLVGSEKSYRLYDVQRHALLCDIHKTSPGYPVSFSPTGKFALAGPYLVESVSGRIVGSVKIENLAQKPDWRFEDRMLILAGAYAGLTIWNSSTATLLHRERDHSYAFSELSMRLVLSKIGGAGSIVFDMGRLGSVLGDATSNLLAAMRGNTGRLTRDERSDLLFDGVVADVKSTLEGLADWEQNYTSKELTRSLTKPPINSDWYMLRRSRTIKLGALMPDETSSSLGVARSSAQNHVDPLELPRSIAAGASTRNCRTNFRLLLGIAAFSVLIGWIVERLF